MNARNISDFPHVQQRKRKGKKKQPKKSQLSHIGLKDAVQTNTQQTGRAASKSVEPHKLPVMRGSSPRQLSPNSQHLICRDEEGHSVISGETSTMDLSLDRLEKLQSKNVSARSEWLAVQDRILALGLRNKCLLDLSMDEARDLFIENHFEALLQKCKNNSKTPLRLPPIRRPAE